MKHKSTFTAFILIFIFIAFLLLKDPFIGIADNSDYYRVIQPLGFEPQISNRYFYAYNFYTVNDMDATDIKGSLMNIINPKVENNNEYFSTQFIFIKISMIINFLIKIILGKSPEIFNIKILGLLYAAMYSYGLYLFLKNINIKPLILKSIFVILSIFVLCDIGYVIYFNSFFGEAPIIASIMLVTGSCIAFIKSEETKDCIYYGLVFFISSILMTGAKVANTPIGILIGLFTISLLLIKRDKITRAIIISGSLIITLFSVFYFISAPDWMNQVNNYQAIFYGILKDSPSPEEDLKELGISEKYLTLANSHGFLENNEFDIYSDEFQKEVYDKSSFTDVLKFYIFNPHRLIDKLVISADNSVIIRPSYLGNYSEKDVPERLSFTNRFSYWSNLRKNTLGYAFYIIAIYSILYFIINLIEIIRSVREKDKFRTVYSLAGMLLFLTTMSQFVLPIIGNGEADLQKHMLLFNICFDLMMLVGVAWLINNYNNKLILKMIPVAAASFGLLLIITPNQSNNQSLQSIQIENGNYIIFGELNLKPINWVVLNHSEENGYLIWSENAVDYKEFDLKDEILSENDYGSNKWETSDIRNWLNRDFKNNFTEEEQKLINKANLKNVLSYNNTENKVGGVRPYYWSAITSYVDQNYNQDAYFNYSEDEIFLLDSYQLKNYVYNNKLEITKNDGVSLQPTRYWLRTPYYASSSMVRMVDEDDFVYHKDANVKAGVVPAMYIKENLNILSGSGTKKSPYIITIKVD